MKKGYSNWKLVQKVMDYSKANMPEFHVLVILASFADENGYFNESMDVVCRKTRLSNAAVYRALKKLQEMHELTIWPTSRRGVNRFRITIADSPYEPRWERPLPKKGGVIPSYILDAPPEPEHPEGEAVPEEPIDEQTDEEETE